MLIETETMTGGLNNPTFFAVHCAYDECTCVYLHTGEHMAIIIENI